MFSLFVFRCMSQQHCALCSAQTAPEALLSFARAANTDGKLQIAFLAGSELGVSVQEVQGALVH